MNVLMYPIAPDDDFPVMFCAIRPCSGEQQFYKPEGERANTMLSRMHKDAMEMEEAIDTLTDGNQRLRVDNAKLRELCEDMLSCIQIRAAFGRPPTEEMYETFYKRARELGEDA